MFFRDVVWFKKVESDLTPASNLAFYRKLLKMTQTELGEVWCYKAGDFDMHGRMTISKKMAKEHSKIFSVSVGRFI